jgi:hypothetical protein
MPARASSGLVVIEAPPVAIKGIPAPQIFQLPAVPEAHIGALAVHEFGRSNLLEFRRKPTPKMPRKLSVQLWLFIYKHAI